MNLGQLIGGYLLALGVSGVEMVDVSRLKSRRGAGEAGQLRGPRRRSFAPTGRSRDLLMLLARQNQTLPLGRMAQLLKCTTPDISSTALALTRGGLIAREGERWYYRYRITDAGRAALEVQD